MSEDVLVIGAGPAGLASAYYLQQAGIPYKVIDRAPVVASTWCSLYPSLRLNTTRFFSHLPEAPFPWYYTLFPTGKQYHRYLANFAAKHRLNIHLGVTVRRVCREGQGWRVMIDQESAWYPAVISATGRFGSPYTPDIPGMERFRGRIVHAHDYCGPEPYLGQRVIVVGNGPSGVDLAAELGRYADRPVLLSQRNGVVLRPRYPFGLPKHIWMILAEALPSWLGDRLMQKIEALKFERLDEIGLKIPTSEEATTAAAGTRGRELIEAVRGGRVVPVDCPAEFEPDCVRLTDGTRVQADVVIMATGYLPVLYQYVTFEGEIETNRDGWPMRVDEPPDDVTTGKREVRGYPGLYLVGTFYQGKGALYNINQEAEAAVEEIRQRLAALGDADRAAVRRLDLSGAVRPEGE